MEEETDILESSEIQGNIIPGFHTLHQAVIGLSFDKQSSLHEILAWLNDLVSSISILETVYGLRENRYQHFRETGQRLAQSDVLMNVHLSAAFLNRIGVDTRQCESIFNLGMYHDAASLGDAVNPVTGEPLVWKFGTKQHLPEVLLIVASDMPALLHTETDKLQQTLRRFIQQPVFLDIVYGEQLDGEKEHFGFRDGVSMPSVRGRLSHDPNQLLTRRYIDPSDERAKAYSKPGSPLVYPGQFIFGYQTQVESHRLMPGPIKLGGHDWMKNGSLMVYRRLEQDVHLFLEETNQMASILSQRLNQPIDGDLVRAWIVGRWPDGTPLMRSPTPPQPGQVDTVLSRNFFDFENALEDIQVLISSTEKQRLSGHVGDPGGLRCPLFSHIRKVNPRDAATDLGPPERTLTMQFLRRGIPFGPRWTGQEDNQARGLHFISYQTSIEAQFKRINDSWVNSHFNPNNGTGIDLLIGQNRAGDQSRFGELTDEFGFPQQNGSLKTKKHWVNPVGGGYFFTPSRSALLSFSRHRAGLFQTDVSRRFLSSTVHQALTQVVKRVFF